MRLNRRRFLQSATLLPALAAAAQTEDDPFASLPASLWKNARRNGLVMIHHPAPWQLSSRARITRPEEPGEPLAVLGRVFAPDGRSPAPGVTVYAYNTDAQGYYGENHAEFPPRIYGWMKTDAGGRFGLRTIRPGRYPGMRVAAHIHFTFWGAGFPPQWVDELRFEGDSYLTQEALAEDRQRGDFAAIRQLTRGDDGVLRCSFNARLGRECNFR